MMRARVAQLGAARQRKLAANSSSQVRDVSWLFVGALGVNVLVITATLRALRTHGAAQARP